MSAISPKCFGPTDLALIYPYPHYWPLAGVIAAACCWRCVGHFHFAAKRFPYLAVGWFWFLGTLVPAIGLVQVGVQSMADRYTYLPSIGLFILVVVGRERPFEFSIRKKCKSPPSPEASRLPAAWPHFHPIKLLAEQR